MDVYFVRLHQYSTSGNMEICFDEEGDSGGHLQGLLSQLVIHTFFCGGHFPQISSLPSDNSVR